MVQDKTQSFRLWSAFVLINHSSVRVFAHLGLRFDSLQTQNELAADHDAAPSYQWMVAARVLKAPFLNDFNIGTKKRC